MMDHEQTWVPLVTGLGAVSVVAYVTTWALGGVLRADYDPVRQAISELFSEGAPAGPATALAVVLVVTGALMVPFALAVHRALPGSDPSGPALIAASGVATAAVAFFPCTPGCPGLGASTTDTAHVLLAGGGYLALIVAPIAVGHRLREHVTWLARASSVLGGLALVGFLARQAGIAPEIAGLQQRVFNTVADAWYVLISAWIIHRWSRPRSRGEGNVPPDRGGASPTRVQGGRAMGERPDQRP